MSNNKPTMDSDLGDCDVLITDCVLDFSKYLTSSDFPASPEEFFDDLFDGDATEKGLPARCGAVKVKEEFCNSTSSSRCSTPESLLPEHDYEDEFPSPAFSESSEDGLMYQLHSIEDGNTQGFDAKVTKALSHVQHQQEAACGDDKQHVGGGKAKTKTSSKRKMNGDKKSNEYRMKRERNNVAVRKSRTKAKIKHIETQMKVSELSEENDQLRNKISLLQRELSSLRNFVAANTSNVMPQQKTTPSYAYPGSLRTDAPSMYSLIMDKSKQNNHMNRVC